MKIVKFGAIALALGLFAASCNNEGSTTETTTTVDSTVTAPAPVETAPVVVDSAAVVAPATDTAVKVESKTETTTEVKH